MRASSRPSPDPANVARYVEEIAPLLGIPIPPECREGVVRNLAVLLAAGLLIDDFPVGDAETAPVFRP
jgi:1-carboxybiuret hydrolase subunit AtzG-like protein